MVNSFLEKQGHEKDSVQPYSLGYIEIVLILLTELIAFYIQITLEKQAFRKYFQRFVKAEVRVRAKGCIKASKQAFTNYLNSSLFVLEMGGAKAKTKIGNKVGKQEEAQEIRVKQLLLFVKAPGRLPVSLLSIKLIGGGF